jgi:hypothetical protein
MTPRSIHARFRPAHFLDGMITTPTSHGVLRTNSVVSTRQSRAPDLDMLSSTKHHSGHCVPLCRCSSKGRARSHILHRSRARGHHLLTRKAVRVGNNSSSSLLTSTGRVEVTAWSSKLPCQTWGGVPVWPRHRVRNSSLSILIVHHV